MDNILLADKPLVSIAIPIFNAEKYLKDAIQSCLNQTYSNFELLLINDGSTDSSLELMKSFSDDRIVIINDGENRGLVERLKQSIRLSKGLYYARMDADDIMFITRIEEQVHYLQSHPEVDVLGASIMTIDDKNRIIGSGLSSGRVNGFIHPTVIGKTTWFKNNPYSDWAYRAEDTELWLRTAKQSNFWALGKPLLFYREFGVPTKAKYIMSQKTLVKIYSHYKEYGKSFGWFLKRAIATNIKRLIYIIFDSFNHTDYLVSKRRRPKVPEALCLSEEDLQNSIR